MQSNRFDISPFHSLRTQLCAGAIALLGITVFSISYFLIDYEKRILRHEIEKSVALQGRNIALSSEKALLRSDPEFELFPLVKNLLGSSNSIRSVVVTDAEGIIYGHSELQRVSQRYEKDLNAYERTPSQVLSPDESLYQDKNAFVLTTPIRSLDKTIGYVHLVYSKEEFNRSVRRAVFITIVLSALALCLGTVLSLLLFRRISEPMKRLMEGVQKLGEGELSTKITLSTRNEFRTLAESFNEMAERIVRAQDELVIKERMQKELEIARDIQATLIPKKVFQPGGYDVGIYYESATEVGGDYIDVIPADSDRLVMVMADVAGKGVPGLVVMAMLKIMVHALVGRTSSPADLLKELNVSIKKTIRPNMFVTLFVGILETKSGEFVYSNAGHNPLVIYDRHRKKCSFHKMAGPPLGIFPARVFNKEIAEYRIRIEPGVLILQYTDGLNESTNDQGQRFGLERIMSICEAYGSDGATSLVPRLARAEQTFRKGSSQMDDIALLALGAKDTVALHQARRAG